MDYSDWPLGSTIDRWVRFFPLAVVPKRVGINLRVDPTRFDPTRFDPYPR
jgi:hypothetical protein